MNQEIMSPNYFLRISAQAGLAPEMEQALLDGADINAKDASGTTILHVACMGGSPRCIHIAIEAGADLEAEDSNGLTAVQLSIQEERAGSAAILLDAGADGSGLWPDGRNMLHWSVIQAQDRLIERSVRQGANIHGFSRSGHTPIALAAERGDVACVKALLQCGANPLHLKNMTLKIEIAQIVSAWRARMVSEGGVADLA